MRIPLDYYRILGLPIQATSEQLQQAYRDRALQLPRREYSEQAIAARKQLLDEAYGVLSDPEKRLVYDTSFLTNNVEPRIGSGQSSDQQVARTGEAESADTNLNSHNIGLDIQNEQFVGALLILHELGEYELLLKLGRPYLSNSITSDRSHMGDPILVRADIVLTLALACLELGREQWQQGQYENAAISLETGQELLLREALFTSLRGEIQADLYKLRPYRILELLALPEKNSLERRSGLQLLEDMLQERRGIDGTAEDQSGLNIDDFLRFIQQLRGYLTSEEQQALFEAEARRPSAVATYLAVYALLARGFAQRQPVLIARAKQMLIRLGRRQDVHLEQSVCALLLGQTEEASRALELSQEYEPLAFIREHSQGAPDLLPGLCLYGERWLQTEVFPHFRDLAKERASLKDYFADEQVQAYLENLPESSTDAASDWAVADRERASYAQRTPVQTSHDSPGFRQSRGVKNAVPSSSDAAHVASAGGQRLSRVSEARLNTRDRGEFVQQVPEAVGRDMVAARYKGTGTATLTAVEIESANRPQTLSSAEGVSRAPLEEDRRTFFGDAKRQRRDPIQTAGGLSTGGVNGLPLRLPGSRIQRSSNRFNFSAKPQRLILLGLAGILGVGILGFVLVGTYNWLSKTLKSFSAPALRGEQQKVQLAQPALKVPAPDSQLTAPTGLLSKETSRQIVQTWLSTKGDALGSSHDIEKLEQILAEPALSRWRQKAEVDKQNNGYWQYKHNLEVRSVETSKTNPDRATVEARVKELAEFYEGGQRRQGSSYDDNLRIQYDLIRKDSQWRIRDMKVLK